MGISLNIFKINSEFSYEEVREELKVKVTERNQFDYKEKNLMIGTNNCQTTFLYALDNNYTSLQEWERLFANKFEIDVSDNKQSHSSYGYILIKIEEFSYILTFGRAHSTVGKLIDEDFALDMSTKMLDKNAIKLQSSKYYALAKNKSITEFKNTKFSSTIGETVDCLKGELKEYPGRKYIDNLLNYTKKNVHFTTSIMLDTKENEIDEETISAIIFNIYNIDKIYKERFKIPKLINIKDRDKELLEKLKIKLNQTFFQDNEFENDIGISFYNLKDSKFIVNDGGYEYRLKYRRKKSKIIQNLTIQDVKNFMEEYKIDDVYKIKLEIISESTKNIELVELLDYTTNLDKANEFFCLVNGKWNRYNVEYLDVIEKELDKVKEITIFDDEFDFVTSEIELFYKKYEDEIKAIHSAPYNELKYNYKLKIDKNGVFCDRNVVNNIEICDVYMNNELIHTKIGNPSNFIECIDQSQKGILVYKNDKEKAKVILGIKKVEYATLILILKSQKVVEEKDISKFDSLRLKINLIEWFNFVNEQRLKPKIIIGKYIDK